MFNNCNSEKNGELVFYEKIKSYINVIFDVGCRTDSIFLKFKGIVHYFDPEINFINEIKKNKNDNKSVYFNNFGLSNENNTLTYYAKCQSFIDRKKNMYQDKGIKEFQVKTGSSYLEEKNIKEIDFLKIDTEGFEYNVLQGFGETLNNVKIIQFEYGCIQEVIKDSLKTVTDYLRKYGFENFYYLSNEKLELITDFKEKMIMANIVCFNKKHNIFEKINY